MMFMTFRFAHVVLYFMPVDTVDSLIFASFVSVRQFAKMTLLKVHDHEHQMYPTHEYKCLQKMWNLQ